jgi:hypothetical protein
MLAKNSRAPRGIWFPASSLTTIASMLAPTGEGGDGFRRNCYSCAPLLTFPPAS